MDGNPILHDWVLIELGVVKFWAHRLLVTPFTLGKGICHACDTIAKLGSRLGLDATIATNIVQVALLE